MPQDCAPSIEGLLVDHVMVRAVLSQEAGDGVNVARIVRIVVAHDHVLGAGGFGPDNLGRLLLWKEGCEPAWLLGGLRLADGSHGPRARPRVQTLQPHGAVSCGAFYDSNVIGRLCLPCLLTQIWAAPALLQGSCEPRTAERVEHEGASR